MAVVFLLVLLLIGILVYVNISNARKRQRRLLAEAQRLMSNTTTQPLVVNQGNVTVRVSTSAQADDPRFQPMAEEIARAFSQTTPEMRDQAQSWAQAMQQGAAQGISPQQAEAIGEAVRSTFARLGAAIPGNAASVSAESSAPKPELENELFEEPASMEELTHNAQDQPVRPVSPLPQQQGTESDPFSAGDVFQRHQRDAEASFSRNTASEDDQSETRNPFQQ